MTDYQWTLTGYRREKMYPGQPDLASVELVDYDQLFVTPDPRGVRELAPSPTRRLTYVLEAPGAFRMPDARGMKVLVGPGVTATLGRANVQASGGVLDVTECWGTIAGGRVIVRNCVGLTVTDGESEVQDDPQSQPSQVAGGERIQLRALTGRGRVELGGGLGPQRLELGDRWQVTMRHDQASLHASVTLRERATGQFDLVAFPHHSLALKLVDDATARVVVQGAEAYGSSEFQGHASGRATLVVDARSVLSADAAVQITAVDDARIDASSRCVVRASGRAHVVARGTCKVYLTEQATVEEIGDDVILRDERAARAAS